VDRNHEHFPSTVRQERNTVNKFSKYGREDSYKDPCKVPLLIYNNILITDLQRFKYCFFNIDSSEVITCDEFL